MYEVHKKHHLLIQSYNNFPMQSMEKKKDTEKSESKN